MRSILVAGTVTLLASGCFLDSSVAGSGDGGDSIADTGVVRMDASIDAGPRPDVFVPDEDAFIPDVDAGEPVDAGPRVDAFVPPVDGGVDAGMDACTPTGLGECTVSGSDDDCDGDIDEDCDCFGTTTRTCTPGSGGCSGTQTCTAGAYGPCVPVPVVELCNGIDDDCNGVIDQGTTCATTGCGVFHRDGHTYLFCRMGDLDHMEAESFCRGIGGASGAYDLATIESSEEDAALQGAANAYPSDRYWIGLRRGSWISGSSASYRGSGSPGSSECALLDSGDNNWGGANCAQDNAFLCEAPSPP